MEAARLLSPYMGKWLKISGQVTNLQTLFGNTFALVIELPKHPNVKFLIEVLDFNEEWKDRLLALPYGQEVTALCRIGTSTDRWRGLENCELIAQKGSGNATP